MRVLWTCPFLMPDLATALGEPVFASGSWLAALAPALKSRCPDLELAIVTMHHRASPGRHDINNISYYVVHSGKKSLLRLPTHALRGQFAEVVADFRPDLIHVNGCEFNHGLIVSQVAPTIPTVLSIQGLIAEYEKVYWGGMRLWDVLRFRTLRDWVRRDGLIEQRWKFRRRTRMEADILRRSKHILGRTFWDRACTRVANPDATYHYAQELIRPEFFEAAWSPENAEPHRIFTVAQNYPIKGLDILLKAASLLKPRYPDLRIRIPGNFRDPRRSWTARLLLDGYTKYLFHLIAKFGLEQNVTATGPIDAKEMTKELLHARVFVVPSFIENLSNSLAEAMVVGTPSVAAYVGGMVTTVHDRVEAYSFPAGDATFLAERIAALFEDESLCRMFSANARRQAHERHNPRTVAEGVVEVYRKVLSDARQTESNAQPQ